MHYFRLYPNMYIVLVGPPGRCKKSTAMRMSRSMLSGLPGINFTSDSVTREKLILDLTQSLVDGHSSMTAYSSEFASLLTSSGLDMVVFLTDIYESPDEWSHKTKLGGTQKIIGPYLNMLGATTPDWIARSLPLDTVGIGLTSRVIFVFEDIPRVRPAFPKLNPEQLALTSLLKDDLATISTIEGEYHMSDEDIEWYDEWYQGQIQQPNTLGDPRLDGYFSRKPMHVLKVAMCVAAAKRNETIILREDMQDAFTLLAATEPRMSKVFAAVGKNILSYDIDQVKDAVASAGNAGVQYSDVLRRFKHNVRLDEMTEIVSMLTQTGDVESALLRTGERILRPGRRLRAKGEDPSSQDSSPSQAE